MSQSTCLIWAHLVEAVEDECEDAENIIVLWNKWTPFTDPRPSSNYVQYCRPTMDVSTLFFLVIRSPIT